VIAKLRVDYYMPIFHPVRWWRHMTAVNHLLDDIGWIDLDF
jgi:hypothetical protein